MNRRQLTGRNALVTGGNRGIGKEIVRRLAEEGCNVIFNSSTQNNDAEQYAKDIMREYGVECIYTPCDIRKPEEIEAMVELAKKRFVRIDFLVNNAGKTCFGDTETLSLNDLNESIKINTTAPFLFCQKVLKMMRENKFGRIINFTTGTTIKMMPNLGGYIHAKMGVNSLTKVLAKEVADSGITVNCIIPGCVDTDMFNDGLKGYASSLGTTAEAIKGQVVGGSHLIKKVINPKLCSDFVVYLCSESGAGLTGGMFPIDHGFTC